MKGKDFVYKMSLMKGGKVEPLFQKVTKALLEAKIQKKLYQMKEMNISFLLLPCGTNLLEKVCDMLKLYSS